MSIKLLNVLKKEITEQGGKFKGMTLPSGEKSGDVIGGLEFDASGKFVDYISPKDVGKKIDDSPKNDEVKPGVELPDVDINDPFLIKPSSKRGSGYGPREGGMHYGIDYRVGVGTNVLVIKPGKVITSNMNADPDGYGAVIYISHDDGVITRYGHMSVINVNVGQRIDKPTVVGKTGGAVGSVGAGNSQGPHLHFEYRPGNTPSDPASGGADDSVYRFLNDSDISKLNNTTK